MKKLMTMIAAVATAFGLYTANADGSYYSTSFEPGYDSGCEGTTFDLEEAGWTAGTTTEETLDLVEYETGEGYAYPKTGKGLRRDALFLGNDTNTKYLKLETGSSSVGKTIGTGEIFIDQTVQFTGFEELPAADAIDGQIAIWASAIEADDTADPAFAGDTNLYVRVGTGSGYEDVKIDIPFNPDNWYRLTIKSIGDVIDSAKGDEHQAGFLVYINGEPATTSAKYSTIADHFNGTAAGYYAKGQLFTGMGDTAAFTTVAFQGLGAIDDFVTSVEAPDFAAEVPFSIAAVNGATPIAAVEIDGQDEIPLDLNDLKVMPGTTVKVTYAPAAGWKLTTDTYSVTVENADQVIDGSSTILPIEGYATLNGAIKGEAELADMMANLAANDTVAFLKEGVVTNGEEDVFYAFNTNTTIAVDANGDWTLTILNSAVETPSAFTIYTDITNNITAAFESGDQLSLNGANIAAGVTVNATDPNGAVSIDVAITVAGALAATTLTPNDYITLVDAGSVWSAEQLPYEGNESIFANEEVAEAGDAQSGYTYTINTTDYVAQIGNDKFATLAEAFAAVEANETATITLLKSCSGAGIFVAANQNKNITLDLQGYTYTCVGPAVGSSGTASQAFHLESGNTIAIVGDAGSKIDCTVDSGVTMLVQNYCNLTVTGVIVDGSNLPQALYWADSSHTTTVEGPTYTMSNNSGTIVLGEDTVVEVSVLTSSGVALDTCKYGTYAAPTVTINGATINGNVELGGGNLALTAGTLNGDLVDAGVGAGTVTKAPAFTFSGATPAGYKWDNGVLTKIDFATLTITQVQNCTVVVSNADNTAIVETGTKFDKDDNVKINVYRTPAAGYELDGCAATEEIMMTANYEATATVKEKAADKPSAAPGSNVKVDEDQQNPGTFIVTPTGDSKNVVIQNVKAGNVIQVDGSAVDSVAVDNADGVTFKVMNKNFDITGACEGLTEKTFSTELDGTKSVQVGTETIKVEPEIATTDAAGEEVEPMVITDTAVTIQVKTIPGLTYQLVKKTALDGKDDWTAVGLPVSAAEARAGLTAAKNAEPASFYKIKVSK